MGLDVTTVRGVGSADEFTCSTTVVPHIMLTGFCLPSCRPTAAAAATDDVDTPTAGVYGQHR